jgi:hypothetical protein
VLPWTADKDERCRRKRVVPRLGYPSGAHGADGGRIASDTRSRFRARGGRGRRRGGRRPRDVACACRHHRPSRQRGRRSGDRAGADRKRIAGAEGQPAGTHRQRDPPAHTGARNRDPGRVADPVTPDAGRRGTGRDSIRSNSTGIRAFRSSPARWAKVSTTFRRSSSRC